MVSEFASEQAPAGSARSTHLLVLGEVTGIHHHKTYMAAHGASVMSGETMFAKKGGAASSRKGELVVKSKKSCRPRNGGCVRTSELLATAESKRRK